MTYVWHDWCDRLYYKYKSVKLFTNYAKTIIFCDFAIDFCFILCYTIKVKVLDTEYTRMISYKKLWKLLIDKDIKKSELAQMAGLSTFTLNKLNHGENVNTDTLVKICNALNCQLEDIMELTND